MASKSAPWQPPEPSPGAISAGSGDSGSGDSGSGDRIRICDLWVMSTASDVASRPAGSSRSSFLKERGRSRPRLVVFSLVCELPDPGWRVGIGVGGQGSGGARPRKRPQGLDGDAVRRTLVRTGRIGKACAAFGLAEQGVGVVFKAGFPAWGRRGGCWSFLRRVLAA